MLVSIGTRKSEKKKGGNRREKVENNSIRRVTRDDFFFLFFFLSFLFFFLLFVAFLRDSFFSLPPFLLFRDFSFVEEKISMNSSRRRVANRLER